MNLTDINISDSVIVSHRGSRNSVDISRPYGWFVEKERTCSGKIESTGVIFLTNRECPFKCLMCDLWKNTTQHTLPPGVIPAQIRLALEKMNGIRQLKLYNSGSFFDSRAIPPEDYPEIASMLQNLETVIVESHPAFIGERCLSFRDLLRPELEVAMGLETVNPMILKLLNKKMTVDDFRRATDFLNSNGIRVRAFILLRPPFMDEEEGIFWARKSIEFAFDCGVESCAVIPVRGGNGIMDDLARKNLFSPPSIKSLEKVLEYGIALKKGRVFADTWDLHLFSSCSLCLEARKERINSMNLRQEILPEVVCKCDT